MDVGQCWSPTHLRLKFITPVDIDNLFQGHQRDPQHVRNEKTEKRDIGSHFSSFKLLDTKANRNP